MYATFVVPAPMGCNLNCPYCAVALRNEARDTNLTDEQYLQFLDSVLRFQGLKKVAIVGYEPTLDEAIELTLKMLNRAKSAGVPTSVNTNGLNLPKHVGRLAYVTDTVMISLDSHAPDINDKMRGMKGTFVGTVAGIRSAIAHMGAEKVIVNTLLVPRKAERIARMPELLASFGVKTWVISPYINFHEGELRPEIDFIRSVVKELACVAERYGIEARYADEFRLIGSIETVPVYNFQRPGEPQELVFRLSPNGSCSIGDEILTDSSVAKVWDGRQDPAIFLQSFNP
ncbi:MAG: radical SAM protein [Candidatus Paceibacterota bacterium]